MTTNYKPQCTTLSEVLTETKRVVELATEFCICNYWTLIKYKGDVLTKEPELYIAARYQENFEFAIAIIEGKAVWRGDTAHHDMFGIVTIDDYAEDLLHVFVRTNRDVSHYVELSYLSLTPPLTCEQQLEKVTKQRDKAIKMLRKIVEADKVASQELCKLNIDTDTSMTVEAEAVIKEIKEDV